MKKDEKAMFVGPEVPGFTIDRYYTILEEKIDSNGKTSNRLFLDYAVLYKTKDNEGNVRWLNRSFFCNYLSQSCKYEDEVVPDIRDQAKQQGVKVGTGVDFESVFALSGVKAKKKTENPDVFMIIRESLKEIEANAWATQSKVQFLLSKLEEVEKIKDIKAICEAFSRLK